MPADADATGACVGAAATLCWGDRDERSEGNGGADKASCRHQPRVMRQLGAAQIADVLSVADEGPDPARQAEDRDQLGALALILGELPDRQREVLIAARLRRERHAIIAARYGVTTRTIEMEIRRALDHCARRLDEMNGH